MSDNKPAAQDFLSQSLNAIKETTGYDLSNPGDWMFMNPLLLPVKSGMRATGRAVVDSTDYTDVSREGPGGIDLDPDTRDVKPNFLENALGVADLIPRAQLEDRTAWQTRRGTSAEREQKRNARMLGVKYDPKTMGVRDFQSTVNSAEDLVQQLNNAGLSTSDLTGPLQGTDLTQQNPGKVKSTIESVLERKNLLKSAKDLNIDVGEKTNGQLREDIRTRKGELATAETIRAGEAEGQTPAGQRAKAQSEASIRASDSTIAVNEGTLDLAELTARNNQKQQQWQNSRSTYEYEDSKATAALEREWLLDRDDAKYDAQAKQIQMQNDADMARYELMLENDREVRRSEDMGDLFGALAMLGGAFMI